MDQGFPHKKITPPAPCCCLELPVFWNRRFLVAKESEQEIVSCEDGWPSPDQLGPDFS